mmetsp:Transcript_76163/g.150611  ORF Transcript_76163/g.150611 Transcript_76163/m.150611 type:complete len:211 (+) Transcript_76163:574-1206(+)
MRELCKDGLDLFSNLRPGGIPSITHSLGVIILKQRLVNFVPFQVAHDPDRIERKAVTVINAVMEKVAQITLRHIAPWYILKAIPDHKVVLIEFLGMVIVEALSAMAHSARLDGCLHHRLSKPVRSGITISVFWRDWVKPLGVGLSEYCKPPGEPGGSARFPQNLHGAFQSPERQLLLFSRERLIGHAATTNGEGIEVRHHWFHRGLCIGD